MIKIKSEVTVRGVSGKEIGDFFISCTDDMYRQWWPGTHLQFHTIKRYPGEKGNVVYFDEFVGGYRLKFRGTITAYDPGNRIRWQIIKIFRLPAWLDIAFEAKGEETKIIHELTAGFNGPGRFFDPLIRLRLTKSFERELDGHAHYEFNMLAELIRNKKAEEARS